MTLGPCPHAYDIAVNGKQQPQLWDDGKLRTVAAALMGLRGVILSAGVRPTARSAGPG